MAPMATILINTAVDMEWLRDVHLKGLGSEYQSAIINGNEDCPDTIEVYLNRAPLYTDEPIVFTLTPDGGYKR